MKKSIFIDFRVCFLAVLMLGFSSLKAQDFDIRSHRVVWNSQSQNSSESMPVGGGDIGVNTWAEDGDIFLYLGKSGAFDENNTLLKLGRIRLSISPNPFSSADFSQELQLDKGRVVFTANKDGHTAKVVVWVDVFSPNVFVDVQSNKAVNAQAVYESWRYKDRYPQKKENNANSWKWAPPKEVVTYKDEMELKSDQFYFFHRNKGETAFDIITKQQGVETIKDSLWNPLEDLTSGGSLNTRDWNYKETVQGKYLSTSFKGWVFESKKKAKNHQLQVTLHVDQSKDIRTWQHEVEKLSTLKTKRNAVEKATLNWWEQFWNRSHIAINPNQAGSNNKGWEIGRNYQLFRFMLACNAYGEYPTKFNGGLFTYDPECVDSTFTFTPDFRNWGGGTHTAQNQRLVYWPMLKSGDFDMMYSQFEFYRRALKNAEWRSKFYWGHKGASFTEQMENFGFPNPAEYGWKRPDDYDKGLEYNAWLEYQWDTVLEFCMMILELDVYNEEDVSKYIPLIYSSLEFFNEHYEYLAKKLGRKVLDENGHLVFYPGSSAETYKMAYNASSTIAALRGVSDRLLSLSEKYLSDAQTEYIKQFSERIPPLPKRTVGGKEMLAPAEVWGRLNNTESPQLYGVYPWGFYGIGKPDLEVAINTYKFDPDVQEFKSHVGWKQHNIFAARLGLVDEAKKYTSLKLQNSERRFPAFWGPGFDWVPDHNWGGSGMIGLQEMLMQVHGDDIYLLPSWPKEWDVDFKLHAPQNTTIQGVYKDGEIKELKVFPEIRKKDIKVLN
ncbi:MAG TPA: DUF5703 domain-containing protein [Candidatus Sphingobacterium stercoripullorum]|nr:DUF5703 domain-containing protein [Candidatus Sphingobacterium stercoripullorum]